MPKTFFSFPLNRAGRFVREIQEHHVDRPFDVPQMFLGIAPDHLRFLGKAGQLDICLGPVRQRLADLEGDHLASRPEMAGDA